MGIVWSTRCMEQVFGNIKFQDTINKFLMYQKGLNYELYETLMFL